MAGLLEVELTQGVTNTVFANQGNFATLVFFKNMVSFLEFLLTLEPDQLVFDLHDLGEIQRLCEELEIK
jgi:hypothetical protein